MTESDTKKTILDAAQKLFSEQGFSATSLRAIIKKAGVNTASIHYHFGTREALIEAVLSRLAEPINRARLEALDALEAHHPDGPLPVEGVVRAFMAPARMLRSATKGALEIPRLMGRATMEAEETRPILGRVMREVVDRFAPAFYRALPGIPREDVEWRVHFMIGAMVFAINVPRARADDDGMAFDSRFDDDAYERLVEFVTEGMRAPASVSTGKDDA